jgi:sigma-B regulation protein RsbU (phosphoserine phosphatase)
MSTSSHPRDWYRKLRERIGRIGIIFTIALAVYVISSLLPGGTVGKVCSLLVMIPTGIVLLFRLTRLMARRSLWSLRNRLLFVYVLLGVLPILLILILVGASAYALTSELAIYLASSALDRRLDQIKFAAETIHNARPDERRIDAPRMVGYLTQEFPGLILYVKDSKGPLKVPATAPEMGLPAGWQSANGLVSRSGAFYGWCHLVNDNEEITLLAPLSRELVSNLVPNLGEISLWETSGSVQTDDDPESTDGKKGQPAKKAIEAGPLRIETDSAETKRPSRTTITNASAPSNTAVEHVSRQLPPPMNRWDVPVSWASTRSHYHWETPGQVHNAALIVQTRASAVYASIFQGTDVLRGVLLYVLVGSAILFLMVEFVAGFIGFALATRVTGAVNSLYEGTRRVIYGDFSHRIPVRGKDQVGELTTSFNQMTDNLERLLVVEKEKERLQTELEIAREVQNQLYPKSLPPTSGLQLTVQCDPARMVSGDYFDYQLLKPGQLAFAIGDVAGKGISAALLMANLQASLRSEISYHIEGGEGGVPLDASQLVSHLNKQLYANTSPEKYATFFFGLYDNASETLTYTNAGHLPPMLFRGSEVISLETNGTVVGLFPLSKYDKTTLKLEPGDLLVCYTDGITEPENAYGEMFGEERMVELVKKHQRQDPLFIIHAVMEAVKSWTGTPELQDDMTLLIARHGEGIKGIGKPETAHNGGPPPLPGVSA